MFTSSKPSYITFTTSSIKLSSSNVPAKSLSLQKNARYHEVVTYEGGKCLTSQLVPYALEFAATVLLPQVKTAFAVPSRSLNESIEDYS